MPSVTPPLPCLSWLQVFDPANDDTFVVGEMKRHLEVYSVAPTGKSGTISHRPLAALGSPDYLTAIPTLNAVHPCPDIDVIVSGTASGRLHVWS